MNPARAFRKRAWRAGATAALTLVASGLMAGVSASSASADVICSYAGAQTTGGGEVLTDPVCLDTSDPYLCSHPSTGAGDLFQVWAQICMID